MRRTPTLVLAGIAWSALQATSTAYAGSYGTEFPFVLGVGARASGLGLAGVSLVGNPSMQMQNPGALGAQQYLSIEGFHTTLFDSDSHYSAFSAAYPTLDFGTIGLTVVQLSIGGVEQRDVDDVVLGTFSNSHSRMLLGYGYALHNGLAIGANLKLDHQELAGVGGTGLGADFGLLFSMEAPTETLTQLRGAIVARNAPGPSVRLDQDSVRDPRAIDMGASVDGILGDFAITTALQVTMPQFSPVQLRAGQEVSYRNIAALRIGVDASTMTYGLGTRLHGVAVDYAYRNEELGGNHRISLLVEFGSSRDERERNRQVALQASVEQQMDERIRTMEEQQMTSMLSQGDSLFSRREFSRAQERYATALLWRPGHPHATERERQCRYEDAMANAHRQLSAAEWAGAIQELEKAAAITPSDTVASLLAQCRARVDAGVLQRDAYERLMSQGIDSYSERRFEQASALFAQAVKIKPTDARANEYLRKCEANLAVARQQASPPPRAAESQPAPVPRSELTDSERKRLDQAMRLGVERFDAGDFARAGESFLRVWEAAPDYENVRDAIQRTYLLLGMDHYAKNRNSDAIRAWETVLRVDPDNVKALRYLARAREESPVGGR